MVDIIIGIFAFIGLITSFVAAYELGKEGVSFRTAMGMKPLDEELPPIKPYQFHAPRKLDI